MLEKLYGTSLSLLTDLYQLTMAYGYWKSGLSEREAVFHLFFRKNPFKGGYAIAAGLEQVVDFLEDFSFSQDELEYLGGLTGNDGEPLFEPAFLEYLGEMKFTGDVYAVPEGTVMFPHAPLIRIQAPLAQAQLIETPLLTMMNFQTLIATKAARICDAAQGDTVLEFGLRRAQGIDGGVSASRAAYIGGCHATSNVLAGKLMGIPVRGTHAHAWVMAFDSELESFEAYASAMPNNCVFLVDTYDTLEGVKKAVQVGKRLRAQGHEMVGVRLDSGDLAALSIGARKILDEGGFPGALIVASNDLNDLVIRDLKAKGARIDVWGVGTKLATAYDQPALGGVYKLSGIRGADGEWDYKVKLSEQLIKVSNPGLLQVRRFWRDGKLAGDLLYDLESGIGSDSMIHPLGDQEYQVPAQSGTEEFHSQDLLVQVLEKGARKFGLPDLDSIRSFTLQQLETLPVAIRKLEAPEVYPLGLEAGLDEFKRKLIRQLRERQPALSPENL